MCFAKYEVLWKSVFLECYYKVIQNTYSTIITMTKKLTVLTNLDPIKNYPITNLML